ncbi:hypothetical protein KEM55_008942 [Ascosphaera atra]|nr:hypothetical protein KEM55_008942 [Ascosphaera atra]
MLTPHDGANVPTPTINPASGPAGNRGEQQPQEPATDIYRSHQEQSNPTEVATSQPSESTLVPTQTAQEGTEGERSSTRSPFAAYDPLPPEVQSREEDRPIPRDDSTSSSIDDLDEVWRQEPSHFAALGSPKKSQADNPSEGETRPLESGSNEAAVAASSEKAGHEHERPSSSSPSGEDKGKYRATVEESFDDDDIA